MGWSNLYHTGSEFLVYIIICNYGDFFTCKRKLEFFSYKRGIAFICGVNGNGCITKESFWTCCGNFYFTTAISIFIIKVIHRTLCILVVNFIISKGCSTTGAPVYKTFSTVHEAAFIKGYKYITYCGTKSFIIGKAFPVPIGGVTKLFLLLYDYSVVFFLYLPCPFQEFFTSQIISGFAFLLQCPFNNILGCNSSMVCSGNPQGIVTLHPVIAHYYVLQGIVKAVSHVKDSGDVWRWNYDSIFCYFYVL